jgi:DUF917 family protein
MRKLNQDQLHTLSLGATILGSGGGGDTKILYDLIDYFMTLYGDVELLSLNDLDDDDLIVPVAFVGAPLVNMERLPNMLIFDSIYESIKADFPTRNIIIMPAEIGGCNALTPLLLALKHHLPMLDADLIGRAFPEINMCKPAVLKASCNPTYLADHHGNMMTLKLHNLSLLEKSVRDMTVHFGSSAGIATFLLNGRDAKDYVIEGSISRALHLGETLMHHHDDFIRHQNQVGSGVITDVFHDMRGGFLFGYVQIKNQSYSFQVHYQNEYMKITKDEQDVAGSPDIIVIVDQKTGRPLPTEALTYGLDVAVYLLEAPSFWLQPNALSSVHYQSLSLGAK